MRKFKEGYYCAVDYRSFDGGVNSSVFSGDRSLTEIAESNFTKVYKTDIFDIRFYSPEHKKVTMEEATEPVKVKKEGWVNVIPYCNSTFLADTTGVYHTRELADESAGRSRVACIKIEWEE